MSDNAKDVGKPTHFRWVVVGLACGTSWLMYMHRYTFALIKPKLIEEWGIGKDQLGLLDSAFSICYSAFQIPLGFAADVAGAHLVLTGLIVLWSLGFGFHAWAPGGLQLAAARGTLGVGQSAVFASLSRITRTWVPRASRTTVQGWVGVFFGRFGGLSANLIVGSLMLGVLQMPWRTVVWILAGFGLLQALLFFVLFRDKPSNHSAVNEAERQLIEGGEDPPPRMEVVQMFRRMSGRSILNLSCLNVQTILSTLADNIYSAWIPLFLYEVHHLEFQRMGIYASLPLLGGALGGAFGGWLNDFVTRKTGSRRWARSGVGLVGKGLAGVTLVGALYLYDQPQAFCIMLFVVKFFSDWSLVTTWGAVTDIGGQATATVFAYNNAVAGLGAIVGPSLYGAVAEHYDWVDVFLVAAATYVVCALSWLAFNCTIPVIRENDNPFAKPKVS